MSDSRPNARAAAARVLSAVMREGKSLSAALPPVLATVPAADRALVQELSYGVLRWRQRLEAVLARLVQKPLKAKDQDLRELLLVGLYQLIYLRTPSYAAVGETVNATRSLGKNWAAGMTNGVLRSFLRERERLLARADADEAARFAHPRWLIDRIRADWPQDWQQILEANNQRPPMALRVNRQRQSRDHYLQRLAGAGISARAAEVAEDGVVLEAAIDVERLPGFVDGDVSVQDAAAQLAAALLDAPAGAGVLDACAAPGGKTAHILERGTSQVVAVDIDAERLARVGETLARLHLNADLRVGDAAETSAWWDGPPFERILLDAPCSATGVIRRHPDIKCLRQPGDIEALAARQAALLNGLWPLLAPGGMLLYATCSILRRENEDQIGAFLQTHGDAREAPIDAPWGQACRFGRQILPGQHGMDGFYYARLWRD